MKKTLDGGKGELSIADTKGDVDGATLSAQQKRAIFEENYKKQNPKKYAEKKASGEFDAQLAKII